MLQQLPLEILLIIVTKLDDYGENIAKLRPLCRHLRNTVNILRSRRAAKIERLLEIADGWIKKMPGRLAVYGAAVFWLATQKRQPSGCCSVEVVYLGDRHDDVPHPTLDGQLAPTWDEMNEEFHGVRTAKVCGIIFNRMFHRETLRRFLQQFTPSIYNFAYKRPDQIEYHAWCESANDDYYNTIYIKGRLLNEIFYTRMSNSGFKLKVV